ncbi:molecular chaperone [Providencia rettgeri]|nr:molecular chaperone [Providencia rettgeri]
MIKNSVWSFWFIILLYPLIASADNSTGFDFVLKRYVYNESNSGGISVDMTNANPNSYLMEAWVANIDEATLLPESENKNEQVPFIILPPLKKMDPNTQTSWNIRRISNQINNTDIPKDRESLYWIGIRAIPDEGKNKKENSVQLNIIPNFYFKLIYRPKAIEELKTAELAKKVKITRKGNLLQIENPTPFYLSFDYLKVAGNSIKNEGREITLTPFSTKDITLPNSKAGKIEWRFTDENLMELPPQSIE